MKALCWEGTGNVHIGNAGRAVVATVSGNIEIGSVGDAEVKTVSAPESVVPLAG